MIAKWKALIPVWTLALCCAWPGQAPAAVFDYYANGFYFQGSASATSAGITDSSGMVTDYGGYDPGIGPYVNNQAQAGIPVGTDYYYNADVGIGASGNGYIFSGLGTNLINTIGMSAAVFANSNDPSGRMTGSCTASMGSPTSDWLYLVINPSKGEEIGAPVTLNLQWSVYLTTGALAGAAGVGDAAITAGSTTIWSHAGGSAGPNSDTGFGDSVDCLVHIGDILGIHLSNSASLDFTGLCQDNNTAYAQSQQFLYLSMPENAVPLPGAIWLLGGGLAALAGLRHRWKY